MGIATINPFNTIFNSIILSYEFTVLCMFIFIYLLQFINIGSIINFINNNHEIFENLLISVITGITVPFGLLIVFQVFNQNNYIEPLIIYSLSLYYSYNTNTIDLLLLLSCLSLCTLFIIYMIACTYSFYRKCNKEKEVIIIRGVPGIGKVSYITSQEYAECDTDNFKLCYWQNYYGKGLSYKYRPNETKQAEIWSLIQFLNAVVSRIPRIYIVSTFEKKWQYEVYVYLAHIMRYKIKIVELECRDIRHLKYFQQRSQHDVPLSRSLRIYNDWEYDERAILQDPYIDPNLKGDSIPLNDNNVNEAVLDKELEEYFKNNGNYVNNKDNIIDNRIRSDYMINYVSNDDRDLLNL